MKLVIFGAVGLILTVDPSAMQVYSSKTVGVRVDALVTLNGAPVGGLRAADFEILDNGVPQRLESIDFGDMPVSVVLAFDASASTAGKRLTDLRAATSLLLDGLKPADKAALTTFNHAVMPRVSLTPDFRSIRSALDDLQPSGGTSLLQGVYAAVVTTLAEPGRSFIIVCTDGRDTTSWLEPNDVVESAKRASAVIYVVASAGARRWAPLKALTDVTGGRMIEIESSAQIGAEFKKILQDFRSRYVLTFTPNGVASGGFHRLDVRIRRGKLKVIARPGYVGEGPVR